MPEEYKKHRYYIITRNEITLEYTVLLIKSDLNIACVLAGGERFELIENTD